MQYTKQNKIIVIITKMSLFNKCNWEMYCVIHALRIFCVGKRHQDMAKMSYYCNTQACVWFRM